MYETQVKAGKLQSQVHHLIIFDFFTLRIHGSEQLMQAHCLIFVLIMLSCDKALQHKQKQY